MHIQLRALPVHRPWSYPWDALAKPPSTKHKVVKRPQWCPTPPHINLKSPAGWKTTADPESAPYRRGNRAATAHGHCWFPNVEQGRDHDKNSSSAGERCPAVSSEGQSAFPVQWLYSQNHFSTAVYLYRLEEVPARYQQVQFSSFQFVKNTFYHHLAFYKSGQKNLCPILKMVSIMTYRILISVVSFLFVYLPSKSGF